MSQQPKTETDRLANVIQVLQLGQKTGMLLVERNDGLNLEQGNVTLVKGHITQASVGQRQGQDAMAWLKNWGRCRFSFSTKQQQDHSGNPGHTLLVQRGNGEQGHSSSFTTPLPITTPGPTSSQQHIFTKTAGNVGNSGLLTHATPFRTCHIEECMHIIKQMGLSRAHQRLFLVIDGRRTLQDFVRLLKNDLAEVHRLLRELERAGVVQT